MKIAWRVKASYAEAFTICTCEEHPEVIVHPNNVAECPKCNGLVTKAMVKGINYRLVGVRRGGGLWRQR